MWDFGTTPSVDADGILKGRKTYFRMVDGRPSAFYRDNNMFCDVHTLLLRGPFDLGISPETVFSWWITLHQGDEESVELWTVLVYALEILVDADLDGLHTVLSYAIPGWDYQKAAEWVQEQVKAAKEGRSAFARPPSESSRPMFGGFTPN